MDIRIEKFAPVVIPTLCRYKHFRNCIESLDNCKYAEETEVFIGVDYPAKPAHEEGHRQIVEYLKTKKFRFKETHIVYRERNYGFGLQGNCWNLIFQVIERFDRYITSEDDNVFSPCFLEYMNLCLTKYQDDHSVHAVCGYLYLGLEVPNGDYTVFHAPLYNAWGTGIWKDRILEALPYYRNPHDIKNLLKDRNVVNLHKTRMDVYLSLIRMSKGGIIHGDELNTAILRYANRSCIYPTKSLVRNMGFDGSGEHCFYQKGFSQQEINSSFDFKLSEASSAVTEQIMLAHRPLEKSLLPLKSQIANYCSYLLYRLTGRYFSLHWLRKVYWFFRPPKRN